MNGQHHIWPKCLILGLEQILDGCGDVYSHIQVGGTNIDHAHRRRSFGEIPDTEFTRKFWTSRRLLVECIKCSSHS